MVKKIKKQLKSIIFFVKIIIKLNQSITENQNILENPDAHAKLSQTETPENLFVRRSSKYLIKPENLTLVKLMFAKVFPIKFYQF